MEHLMNSAINQAWKLCSVAGFIVLFLVTFLLTNYSQPIKISDILSKSAVDFDTSIISDVSNTAAPAPAPGIQHVSILASSPQHSITHIPIDVNAMAPVSSPVGAVGSGEIRPKSPSPTTGHKSPGPTVGPNNSSGNGGKGKRNCKMYEGKWVYNPEENPRYNVQQCPFLEEKMSCQNNGRPDLQYESWGWESNYCSIPLFDGKNMMEKLRGKRVIIVGDSLNRNMWESLACLLYTSISPHRAIVKTQKSNKLFKAKDYDFSLEFYWAPFLVHLDKTHKSGKIVVVLDNLDPSSAQWRGSDVMVFNTGHWWNHNKYKSSHRWDFFQIEGKLVKEMKTEVAYERALSIWAQWIRKNVEPTKTKVFFRSVSPQHKSKYWCFNASRLIMDESYKLLFPRSMIDIAKKKVRELDGHVRYLNITKLSGYRRDAHPSIYRFKDWKSREKEELLRAADCSHWCLPGLPDTWNRLLYASILSDRFSPGDLTGSS